MSAIQNIVLPDDLESTACVSLNGSMSHDAGCECGECGLNGISWRADAIRLGEFLEASLNGDMADDPVAVAWAPTQEGALLNARLEALSIGYTITDLPADGDLHDLIEQYTARKSTAPQLD